MPQTIQLRYKDGAPLNAIADFIIAEKPRLVERLDNIEMIKGASTLFGSGDDKIVTITLQYTNPTEEDLADIHDIIQIAKNYGELEGASQIDVMVDAKEEDNGIAS